MFFKSFDSCMKGRNNYQFFVGQIYETSDTDTWNWFHYAQYISSTLIHNNMNMRICEVKPLGELEEDLGYSKYDYKNKQTDNSRNGSYTKTVRSNPSLEKSTR